MSEPGQTTGSILPVPPPPPSREPASGRALLTALQSSIGFVRWAFGGLVLVYLLSGVSFVGPGQAGVVFRFGKILPDVRHPGILIAMPRPFDRVELVSVAEQRELLLDLWRENPNPTPPPRQFGDDGNVIVPRPSLDPEKESYTLTGDRNIVRGEFSLRYQVDDPVAFLTSAREHEAILSKLFYASLSSVLAGEAIDPLLGPERERIRQETLQRLRKGTLDLNLGVQVLAVEFRQLLPPSAVADAFREVASAEVEARTLLEQARSARAALLPAALGEASSIRSQAEAEASALLARVRGEVEAFATIHEAFRASPDGFQERLLAETLAPLMPLWRGLYVVPSGAPAPRLLLPRPGGAP